MAVATPHEGIKTLIRNSDGTFHYLEGTNGKLDVSVVPEGVHAEDAAHVSGDEGSFILGVRNDAAAARTSADGDYSPIATDSAGRVGIADLGGTISVRTAAGNEVAIVRTSADPLDTAGTATAIKYVNVAATVDGDNVVVAAVTGRKLRVLGYHVQVVTTAGIFKFQDTAVTPVVFAEFDGAIRGTFEYSGGLDAPAFDTALSLGLEINTAAGVDVKGHLTYIEV